MLFWWQFTNMQNCETNTGIHLSPSPPRATLSLPVGKCKKGKRGKNLAVTISYSVCVLTIQLLTPGMSSRKSSQLEDLLMYFDSGCQQFSSALCLPVIFSHLHCSDTSSKACSLISHTGAASIVGLLWFGCVTLCPDKDRCFQKQRLGSANLKMLHAEVMNLSVIC